MKKPTRPFHFIVLFFLLTICSTAKAIYFIAPPDTASDVITLINGKLIYCKVKSIGHNKVKYIPSGSNKDSIKEIDRMSVLMVNYPNGESRILTVPPSDTLHKGTRKRQYGPFVDIYISGGISSPASTYGSSAYVVANTQTGGGTVCGFASPGFTGSAMFNLIVWKGFKLTCKSDYIHSGFDANTYLHEWADLPGSPVDFINPNATGTYSYNNFSFFVGITGSVINLEPIYFDLRFLVGAFYLNFPDVQGTGYSSPYWPPYRTNVPVAINLPGANIRDEALDLGATIGYRVLSYMRVVFNTDFIFAGGGADNFKYNVLGSNPYDPNVSIFNFTLGVQFEL